MGDRASAPIAPGERQLSLDVIRGFAIFGVLLAYLQWDFGSVEAEELGSFDTRLMLFFEYSVDGKFYTMLSFLFGLGFFLIIDRAQARGADVVGIYLRRLAVLAVFGLLHQLLLRDDILLPYAVTGLFLLPFRKASNRVILVAVFALLFYSAAVREVWQMTGMPLPKRPDTEGLGHFASRVASLSFNFSLAPYWLANLGTFLLGFYAGRNRILQRAGHPRALALAMLAGFAAGLALYLGREWYFEGITRSKITDWQRFVAGLLYQTHGWATAAGYISGILLLLRSERWRRGLRPLAVAGRMALTNYVMQAAIAVPLCFALGLYDLSTPIRALLAALLLFLMVQVPFSVWWLRNHRYGPLEWLWRRLTYGEVPASEAGEPLGPAGTRVAN